MNPPSQEERLQQFTRIFLLVLLFVIILDNGGMGPIARFSFWTVSFILGASWLIFRGIGIREYPKLLIITVFLVILWGLISAVFSSCPFESLSYWFILICGIIVFLLTFQAFRSSRDRIFGMYFYFLAGILVSCIGIYIFGLTYNRYGTPMYSIFYQADIFAAYLLLFFPLTVIFFVVGKNESSNLLCGALSLLFGVCLLLTYSRAGWLSAIVVIMMGLIYLLTRYSEFRYRWKWIVIKIVLMLILTVIGGRLLSGEGFGLSLPWKVKQGAVALASGRDHSVTARLVFWKAAVKIAQMKPFLGVGPDLFSRYYARVQDDLRYFSRYVHSSFFEFWCETGYPGIIFILGFLGILFYYLFSGIPDSGEPEGILYVGGLCSLAGGLVHSLVDMDWKFPGFIITFFFLAGMLLSYGLKVNLTGHYNHGRRLLGIIMLFFIPLFCFNFISELYAGAGRKNVETGNIKTAYKNFSRSIMFNPLNGELRRDIAKVALRLALEGEKKYLDVAFRHARRAIKLDPMRTSFRILLGRLMYLTGKYEEALDQFKIAHRLDYRNYPEINNYLADIYLKMSDKKSARKYLKEIINSYKDVNLSGIWHFRRENVNRQVSRSYSVFANLEMVDGNKEQAMEYYKKAISLDQSNSAAYYGLGLLSLENKGSKKESLKYFEKVVELDPDFPDAWLCLARIYKSMGFAGKAEEARLRANFLMEKRRRDSQGDSEKR
ncbi:MAG: O-antigen ligase family protein [Candidatus Eremiobacteraeota bacterium]|nr:O-antigen ligase family protein [Candidatus Eremiobacteraeota bacterium]